MTPDGFSIGLIKQRPLLHGVPPLGLAAQKTYSEAFFSQRCGLITPVVHCEAAIVHSFCCLIMFLWMLYTDCVPVG